MARLWWLTGAFALLLILAPGAQAQRALDRDTVTRWMAAAQAVQVWAEEQGEEDFADELFDGEGMPTFADIERAYSAMYEREPEVRSAARAQGFRNTGEWGNVSARITMGLMHLEMADHDFDAEMAGVMRELEEAPDMPPEMRDMIRQQMQQTMGNLGRMTEGVQEADLPILRELQPELRAVIGFGEDADGDQ